MTAASHTNSAEALLEAMSDEAVSSYIFSEGSSKSKNIHARLATVICPDLQYSYCKDKY